MPRAPWHFVAALTFGCLFPLALAVLSFVVLGRDEAGANLPLIVCFSLGKVVQFAFPFAYFAACFPEKLAWQPPNLRGMAWGLGFALAVSLGMGLLFQLWLRDSAWTADTSQKIFHQVQQLHLDSPERFLLFALFLSAIHSLLEEIYWRWFVFDLLDRRLGFSPAMLISAAAFALHHIVVTTAYFPWFLALPFACAVGVGGGFWAWLYRRSGSLASPWISHLLIDAAIMAVGYAWVAPYWQ